VDVGGACVCVCLFVCVCVCVCVSVLNPVELLQWTQRVHMYVRVRVCVCAYVQMYQRTVDEGGAYACVCLCVFV
jgi:hypothetical protein